MKRIKHSRTFFTWRNAAVAVVVVGLFFTGGVLIWLATLDIPSVDSFHNRKVPESTKIYDRTGDVLLYDVHGAVRRTLIPLEDVSRHIRNATLAIEDAEFYQHRGVKPDAILRAAIVNLREGRFSQGGSTITQQVIKNTVLTNEKTITRKIKEWVLALKIEQQLTKDEIFEIYLNETPYGGTIYGVEEASLHFFGKTASDVSLAEAAYLAALPQAPTYYSPFGNHREELEARKNTVLDRMLENNFITEDEYQEALGMEVTFIEQEDTGIKAPHFVFYVREYLEEEYGVRAVNEEGLVVTTTLDFELQARGEEILKKGALENEEKFNAENAGLVAIDPQNGQILTMVGSRDYFDEDIDGKFNIARAKRQPGSAFKPFVYAAAFEKGYTPETVVFDVATQFNSSCEPENLSSEGECYAPSNYDDEFRGPMTLRNALAQSVNIPAVKVLYLTGVDAALDMAQRLGITTLEGRDRYGLTLVLGGGEVSLLDITSAYSVFANEGVRHEPTAVLQVESASGEMLEEYKEEGGEQVLPARIAQQVSDVLSDNRARTPAFGSSSYLHFPGYDVAAKTGTTNDYRDAWIVGYTPEIAVGTWAGNNDNTSMEKRVAGFIVAPMWNAFMQVALEKGFADEFTEPGKEEEYDSLPPMLRGVWNTASTTGEGVHSILYWVDKDDPRGGQPRYPERDAQFIAWEQGVARWALGEEYVFSTIPATATPPTSLPPIDGTAGRLEITNPGPGSEVPVGALLDITVAHPQKDRLRQVAFYINDAYIGASTRAPFTLSFVPSEPGEVRLRASAQDALGGVWTDEVVFTVR